MEFKEIISKYGVNLTKGLLPAPLAAIIDTINECNSENELKLKFNELKQYAEEYSKRLKNSLPSIPISVEVEYASIVVLYYLIEPDNINTLLDTKQLEKEIATILEERKNIDKKQIEKKIEILEERNKIDNKQLEKEITTIFKGIIDSIEEYEVCADYIILQSQFPLSKSDWQDGSIRIFKEILNEEFNIKIKSILYI